MVLACLWTLAAILAPTPEVAVVESPATIDLRWSAPQECPDAADVERRWLALLAGAPAGSGVMTVYADVERDGPSWVTSLRTEFLGVADVRVLHGETCDAVAEATATVVAIALEPEIGAVASPSKLVPTAAPPVAPNPEPEPVSEPDPKPVETFDPIAPVEPEPEPAASPPLSPRPSSPKARVRGLLRPQAGAEYGALPGVTASLGAAGGVLWPRLRVEVDLAWLAPRQEPGPRQSRVVIQTVVGAIHACARARLSRLEFPICGGLEGGVVYAAPRGLPNGAAATGPMLGPSFRTGFAFSWQRVGVFAALGVVPRAWATRLRIDDTVVFRPELVSLRLVAGVEFFFGAST